MLSCELQRAFDKSSYENEENLDSEYWLSQEAHIREVTLPILLFLLFVIHYCVLRYSS